MPVTAEGSVSFRLNGKLYAAEKCICLYRALDPEEMVTQILLLTRDGRFAYIGRVIGGKGVQAAEDWTSERSLRFLIQHGEGDLVDEFPDVFRRRSMAPPRRPNHRRIAAAPNGRPAEPYLFPLG